MLMIIEVFENWIPQGFEENLWQDNTAIKYFVLVQNIKIIMRLVVVMVLFILTDQVAGKWLNDKRIIVYIHTRFHITAKNYCFPWFMINDQ